MNTTVVYYTSNQEEEKFEAKIRENLLKVTGNLSLIFVSQKPIDFGKNICVGDVGVSNQNAHRHIISIKTGNSMHGSHTYSGRVKILPHWGIPEEVINKFL